MNAMSATANIGQGNAHGQPDRHRRLAVHFDSMEQQHNSAKLGMWLFLITEILLFSGLFLSYTVYRIWNPEVFRNASSLLSLTAGTVNTVVLITSSLTMALAVRAAQMSRNRALIWCLAATVALAGVFMVIKYFEYSEKFSHGLMPGRFFHPDAHFVALAGNEWIGRLGHVRTFFSIYFMMTGLHGFHVLGGMAVIGWLIVRAIRGDFDSEYYTPVECVGLYWHIVDMIWIFLFPVLYLVDRTHVWGSLLG
jgi:cytochrome c oxidase subunit 3